MRKIGRSLIIQILFLLALAPSAKAIDEFSIGIQSDDGTPKQIHVETQVLGDGADVAAAVEATVDPSADLTIVSSEDPSALTRLQRIKSKLAFLPFGRAINPKAEVKGGINRVLRNLRNDAVHGYQHDKAALLITTYSMGATVIQWIHTDSVSTIAMTAAILYSVVTDSVFSLTNEAWERSTAPIEARYRERFGLPTERSGRVRPMDALASFFANWSLTTKVTLGFIPILAIDQMAHGNLELHTFTIPLFISFFKTAAGFSWSGFNRSIDRRTHPAAKAMAQVLVNSRKIAMATLASTAMLLSYKSHGMVPWISLAGIGTAGMILYFNSTKLATWFESTPLVKRWKAPLLAPPSTSCEGYFGAN